MSHIPDHAPGYRARHRCRPRAGFTLVELLVVLVILGLLAGLVAPRVMSQLEGAKVDAARAQIDKLSAELDIYRLNNGSYPERLEHLLEAPPGAPNWKGPYVKTSSLTDPWGEPYRYRYPGEYWDYDLYSLGADRSEGGEGADGDITNWD